MTRITGDRSTSPIGKNRQPLLSADTRQLIRERIRPLDTAKWSADYSWSRIETAVNELGDDYGGIELDPDFQRGHVWTESQQVHFIENCLRGVVASDGYLIQFNCPNFDTDNVYGDLPDGLQCLDGLQRFTAVCRFVRGEIGAFGLFAEQLAGSEFSVRRRHFKLAIHTFQHRSNLLEHYLALNAGGTPHSTEEIQRVRGLLAASYPA